MSWLRLTWIGVAPIAVPVGVVCLKFSHWVSSLPGGRKIGFRVVVREEPVPTATSC